MKRMAESEAEFWKEFTRLNKAGVVTPTHGIKYPVLRFTDVGKYVGMDDRGVLYWLNDGTMEALKPSQQFSVEQDVLLDSIGVVCLTGVFDPQVALVLHEPKGMAWQ